MDLQVMNKNTNFGKTIKAFGYLIKKESLYNSEMKSKSVFHELCTTNNPLSFAIYRKKIHKLHSHRENITIFNNYLQIYVVWSISDFYS